MDTNDTRRTLELEKLRLEITLLNRPWWRHPVYVLAALPTALGIISLIVAWTTGLLDAKSVSLETRRTILEADVKSFAATREELSAQNQQLAGSTDRLQSEKAGLTADVARLRQQAHGLSAKVHDLDAEKVLLQRANTLQQRETTKARASFARHLVATARAAPRPDYPRHVAEVEKLLNVMKSDSRLRDACVSELGRSDDDEFSRSRAFSLQLIVAVSGADADFEKLVEYVANWFDTNRSDVYADSYVHDVLGRLSDAQLQPYGIQWPERWRRKSLTRLIEMLEAGERETTDDVMAAIFWTIDELRDRDGDVPLYRSSPDVFIRIVAAAHRTVVGFPANPDKSRSLRAPVLAMVVLKHYAPSALVVTVAEQLAKPQINGFLRTALKTDLSGFVVYTGTGWVSVSLNVPKHDSSAEWEEWRSKNAAVIRLWSGDMSALRDNAGLLARALQANAFE
jgi:hypothetical protein